MNINAIYRSLKDIYQGMVTGENYRKVRADYQEVLAIFKNKQAGRPAELPENVPETVKQLYSQIF